MNYNKKVKWIGINKAQHPIAIIENGVERIIPAIDTTKTKEANYIKLDPSCYDANKEMFYIIKEPQVQAQATIDEHQMLADRAEKNKDKKLIGKKITIPNKEQKATIIMDKRNHKAGKRKVYKWTFHNVEEKKDYDVKSVKKFCDEKGITFHNNCYKVANTDKEYQGWKIKKEPIN